VIGHDSGQERPKCSKDDVERLNDGDYCNAVCVRLKTARGR